MEVLPFWGLPVAPPMDTPPIISQITINLRDKRTVGKVLHVEATAAPLVR